MKRILIALCLANLIACSSPDEPFQYEPVKSRNWVFVSENIDKSSKFFVDANSIKGNSVIRKAWYKEKINKCSNKNKYCEIDNFEVFSCSSKEISLRQVVYRKNGKLVDIYEPKKNDWISIIPDTIGASLIDFVCSY